MTHFTKYAEQKFDILNKYNIFYTREQIEDVINTPNKVGKKDKYTTAEKDGIRVIYEKGDGVDRVITFFPVK